MTTIGFGGGCHWCTEAIFQPLRGVLNVRQGFIQSDAPDDTWSEAVEVTFDPDVMDLKDLVAVHLGTHASESEHKMRGKYRSAIYATSSDQSEACEAYLSQLASETGAMFVTRVLCHRGFKPSDERFHSYYEFNPERPFCRTYIEPKLAKLRALHSALLNTGNTTI